MDRSGFRVDHISITYLNTDRHNSCANHKNANWWLYWAIRDVVNSSWLHGRRHVCMFCHVWANACVGHQLQMPMRCRRALIQRKRGVFCLSACILTLQHDLCFRTICVDMIQWYVWVIDNWATHLDNQSCYPVSCRSLVMCSQLRWSCVVFVVANIHLRCY